MSLFDDIIAIYPELTVEDFYPRSGSIRLQNDGNGDYIAKWEYSQPIPDGLSLGEP
jgi:hypothetical protein